jgi:NAD(P)-dependent dehydrogenase (short-subunit alcohol dehydrogenase family)
MIEKYHGLDSIRGQLSQSRVPLQRAGTVEDMAGLTLFLTSRAGAYLNGNIVLTDGGRLGVLHGTY